MTYIYSTLLSNGFRDVHGYGKQYRLRPSTALLLHYRPGETEFKAHQDDKRHRHAVMVVSLVGYAYIIISNGRGGPDLERVRVGPGDVYALTKDALTRFFHRVEPDPTWTGDRYVLTLRNTNLHLETQWVPPCEELKRKRLEDSQHELKDAPAKRKSAYRGVD